MKQLLDNGALVTLGLVAAVAAVGAANKAGLYGSRAHAFPLLHRPIRSQADAEAYLRELMSSGHSYHLEDDASDIVRTSTGEPLFTAEQARLANQRAEEVFAHFTRGDPFAYMFDLLES
jgi:hypothetical protein